MSSRWAIAALLSTALLSERAPATPAWAKNGTQELSGSIYRVVCSGRGPSIDLARREAELSCKASAAGKLSTKGSVTTVTVETDKDVGLHQEVSEHVQYKNLACTPEREEIEDGDGQVTVWIRCRFDLSKAGTESTPASAERRTSDQAAGIKDRGVRPLSGSRQTAATTTLSVNSVPQCDSILISGVKPRVVRCDSNPVAVVTEAGDATAIIRAKGYQSKTIELGGGGKSYEAIQVILEAN